MPTATDFSLAASCLRNAIADVAIARAPVDGIGDHGVHGGSLQTLVDRALEEQIGNLDALGRSLEAVLEVAEHRQLVCEEYARSYSRWVGAADAWDLEARETGPNMMRSRPAPPRPPAPWAER